MIDGALLPGCLSTTVTLCIFYLLLPLQRRLSSNHSPSHLLRDSQDLIHCKFVSPYFTKMKRDGILDARVFFFLPIYKIFLRLVGREMLILCIADIGLNDVN